MCSKISDDYFKNIDPSSPNKISNKEFQQLVDLLNTETQIQQLSQIKDIAKHAEKGNMGASLMASSPYEQTSIQPIAPPSTNLLETLKNSVQSELSYLYQMLNILRQSLGSNNPEVQKIAQEIAQLKAAFPNLTPSDVSLINNIMNQALNLEGQLGSTAQVAFLKAAQQFLKGLQAYSAATISTLNQELAAVNAQLSNLTALQNDMSTIENLLKLLQAGTKLSSTQMMQLLNSINDLNSRYSSMPIPIQKAFENLMQGLSGLSSSGTPPLTMPQFLADLQMYEWTQQYLSNPNNPDTQEGLLQYIQAQIAACPNSQNNPFLQAMLNRMNADVANFPGTGTAGEQNWVNFTGGVISSNSDFMSNLSSIFVGPFANGQEVISELNMFVNQMGSAINQLNQQAASYQASINALNQLNSVVNAALNKVDIMLIYTESLQQAFANAILNHFMPGQENYLRELAAILFMDNFGTNMNNVLMNDILDFSDAANNYNLNNWIQSRSAGNGNYTGSATAAAAQAAAEKAQAQTDENKCSKAIADISAQEANLAEQVKEGKISPSNAAKIKQELEKDRASLVQAKANLQTLITDIGQMTFQNVGNGQFKIVGGDLNTVAADEQTVVNGDPTQNGLGGLTTIAGDIESSSQYWGGQSQTAQMQLQMTMTQVQQEWAVVTTALQLLNQMYMAVAQAISK